MQCRLKMFNSVNSLLLVVLSAVLLSCGDSNENGGKVLFTQVPSDQLAAENIYSISSKYVSGSQIAMASINIDLNELEDIEVLTGEFSSARAPEVSYDGNSIVFSAQKNNQDTWQIWILDLESDSFTQVTSCKFNCTDPAWLPDGRIVFSKQVEENELTHHALFTIAADGCCEQRITFQPHDDTNATVLNDGRILMTSQQLYPEVGPAKYLAMRPDGTKAELFQATEIEKHLSEAEEDRSGKVLFAESGLLSAVSFARPTKTKIQLSNGYQVNSIDDFAQGNLLVSRKLQSDQIFGLAILNKDDLHKDLFSHIDPNLHLLEATIISRQELPRKLPSRVNTDLETGYFVCMDVNASEIEVEPGNDKTMKVQVLGMDQMIGEAEVAEDGSFYLELKADQAVRFQTVNESGEIVRGPSSWMWVRPNERRGCVGCHQDREIAPENVVPLAIEKAPVAMIK